MPAAPPPTMAPLPTVCRLLVGTALALGVLRAQTITVAPERGSATYQPGETVRWLVTVTNPADLRTPTYTIKSGGRTSIASGSLVLTNGQATLEASLAQPGSLLLQIDGKNATGASLQAFGGAVVAPEQITPAAARPDDFDTFWDAKLAELAAVPINPVVTASASGVANVDYATVTLDCIRGTHVQGQLARPTAGTKFPALLIVQWAGVYSLQKSWATSQAANGWLVLNTQAHDITPVAADSYYTALAAGALKDYWRQGNEDRETSYFLRMFLACHRAAEYLTTRPDWDGRTLVVMGASQGGLQTLVAAALHPKVTAALAEVPAGADQAGRDVGRQPGWPVWADQAWDRDLAKVMQTSRYYDALNFVPRIRCPVLLGVGFIDTLVPPPGVFVAFNQLTGARQIVPMPLADHSNNHSPYYNVQSTWLADARTARTPTIVTAPQPASAKSGEAAAFSVVAGNGLAFGYQWLKNGALLPGATLDHLALPAVSAGDDADYAVTVTSPGGSITSSPVHLTVVPTVQANLAAWATAHGLDASVSGFVAADPDGDGTSNLLEFVLGGTPTTSDAATTLPSVTTPTDSSGARLVVTYRRARAAAGVSVTVETSLDLVQWTTVTPGAGATEQVTPLDAALEQVVVTIPCPDSPLFARVQASL